MAAPTGRLQRYSHLSVDSRASSESFLHTGFLSFLLKPTTAGLVFRTLTGTTRCLENSFLCLTYIAETLVIRDGTRLALATYNVTLYVSILFDMRDSGGFPTFHSLPSFSVSMISARLFLYKRPYSSCFFSSQLSFILSSSSFDL